jgi:magnesium transporter
MPETITTENNTCTPVNAGEAFEKHWFCAAVCNDGSVVLQDADSPSCFLEILRTSLLAWVDYRTSNFDQDVRNGAAMLGFSEQLTSALVDNPRLLYEDYDTEMGIKLPSIQIRLNDHIDVQSHTTILFLKRNFILTVHPILVDRRFTRLRRYSSKILSKIPIESCGEDKLTMLLIRIVDQNNDRNFEHLRQIEERGDDLNKCIMDPEIDRNTLGPRIYDMKHSLITYLDALWDTVDVLHDLRYGDANLLTDEFDLLHRIGLLAENVNRQIGLAEHMSDVLASGLEVLQTIYNNQLQAMNNRIALLMTYLTVLGTAVLVPNTLATVLGNSAFGMTVNDAGWYIALLVVSTVVATVLAFLWVRNYFGIFPRKKKK